MIRLTLDEYLMHIGMTRYELAKRTEIGFAIIDKYYKNKVVRYDSYVLDRMCEALGCKIEDLIEYSNNNINNINNSFVCYKFGSGFSLTTFFPASMA